MDDHGGSGAGELSLEDLMDEYSSRPSQIAEWLWCVEYAAKFVKDLRRIRDLMNMGYQYSNDYGKRINEVLSLRVLEFMFDPCKNDAHGVGVGSTSEEKVEFDLSLSSAYVLRAILREIQVPVSELRAGMPELSKFNVLPFIAHKNLCLPQCALEKLRDVSFMENQTTPSMEADDPVFRDDRSVHMDTCEEEPIDEQQVHIGLDQNINEKEPIDEQQVHIGLKQNINEKNKVIAIDDEDEPMHTNEKGEVIVINDGTESEQDTTSEPINNGNATDDTFPPSSRRCPEDSHVKCTKDGTWLISGSDDESDKDPASVKKNPNTYLNSSSQTRPENVCWKCEKEGTLLICSRSECATKVHKECLNGPVNVDEDGNFLCPLCWYDRVAMEYHESQKLISCAKRRLVKCFPVFSVRSKRVK
ncbi:hypothetical protein CARUB_v10009280mg [Capsella rubella]|uniref:PHD-type domain-containing protein n=1 Tax=Capsella rubella TaxID=81985 RepID=R0IPD4_9BRAS|nr:uncharacterized protein LOC17898636 [Capsella rubella]EOA40550.1 hypothetical protein CARUB_v10009280mg [Capsella rubella]EOA40551.1 hypothetical protein CARUB_v10009280mg [Capsella rubella]